MILISEDTNNSSIEDTKGVIMDRGYKDDTKIQRGFNPFKAGDSFLDHQILIPKCHIATRISK